MENENNELGFTWWKVWAWIGLTLGNLTIFLRFQEEMMLAITLIVIFTILNVMILKFNKYVFHSIPILGGNVIPVVSYNIAHNIKLVLLYVFSIKLLRLLTNGTNY